MLKFIAQETHTRRNLWPIERRVRRAIRDFQALHTDATAIPEEMEIELSTGQRFKIIFDETRRLTRDIIKIE